MSDLTEMWAAGRGVTPDSYDDRRAGGVASFYRLSYPLTILISGATPAPYRYTGQALVHLISVRLSTPPQPAQYTTRNIK